jgi:putative inorganic carbon (HCO3(-)) transporter
MARFGCFSKDNTCDFKKERCVLKKEKMVNNLDRGIRLSLFALIFLLPFSNSAVEICFGFAFALWVVKHFYLKSFKVEPSPLNGPIYVFICIGILSVIGSVYFKNSLHAFFSKFMEGIFLYFLMIETIKQKKHVYIIIGLFLFVAAVMSFDGIIQYFFTGIDIFRQRPIVREGATAAFDHPNKFGGYLLFPLFMALAMLIDKLNAKKINLKLLALFCALGLLFFILALTKSKGAWLGFIVTVLFFIFCINRKVFLITMVTGVIISALAFSVIPDYFLRDLRLDSEIVRGASIYRIDIWKETLNIVKNRPALGYGINTYMSVLQKYRRDRNYPDAYPTYARTKHPTYAHNCYLQMAAEMGLAGLIVFLWIVAKFFKICISKKDNYVLLGITCGIFAFLVHSFVDTNLYSLQLNTLFWFMLGLAVAKLKID